WSPRRAVILRDEEVRLQIVRTMSVDGEITGARVEVRRLDPRDVIGLADARHVLRNVGPGGAIVFTDLNVAVVSADPEYAGKLRRLADSHNVTVTGVAVVLRRHRIFSGHTHDRQRAAIDRFCEIDGRRPGVTAIQ